MGALNMSTVKVRLIGRLFFFEQHSYDSESEFHENEASKLEPHYVSRLLCTTRQ